MAGRTSTRGPQAEYNRAGDSERCPRRRAHSQKDFHIPTDSYANAVPGKFHAVGVQACLHGRFSSPRGLGCRDQLAP